MLKTIFVDGDKGGVGKSLVSRALVDMYLHDPRQGERDVVVFDADRSNPDVCGSGGYCVNDTDNNLVSTHLINLETESGWSEFGDRMEAYVDSERDIRVIISMPAQIGPRAFDGSIPLVGEILRSVNAIPVWVMSRTQDCMNALENRRKTIPAHYEHGLIVKNLFFGATDKFTLWKESLLRQEIVDSGDWAEVDFPECNDILLHKIGRTPFQRVLIEGISGNRLGMGSRLSLETWRHEAWQALTRVEDLPTGC
jgi:hypothetical protein